MDPIRFHLHTLPYTHPHPTSHRWETEQEESALMDPSFRVSQRARLLFLVR